MSVGPVRTAFTRVGKILETVEAVPVAVLLGVLEAHQILFVEAVVDLDVELPVIAVVWSCSDPVPVNTVRRGDVRLREVTQHLLRYRIDQIPRHAGGWLKVGGQVGAARTGVGSEVVEGNERISVVPYRGAHIGVVSALVWIPELTLVNAATAGT